jgi:carboxylesterase type B
VSLALLLYNFILKQYHDSRTPLDFGSSNTDEGARWSALLPVILANTSAANATESTVFNFLQGQFDGLTQQSINQAIEELYPLEEYDNSLSLQGQQMYGEARYICTAALIADNLSVHQRAYQYQLSHLKLERSLIYYFSFDPRKMNSYDNPHLGSDHADELEAFFETPEVFSTSVVADAKDNTLFHSMREYWTSFVTTGRPVSNNGIAWEVRYPFSPLTKTQKEIILSLKACKGCKFWKSASFLATWERVDGRETKHAVSTMRILVWSSSQK